MVTAGPEGGTDKKGAWKHGDHTCERKGDTGHLEIQGEERRPSYDDLSDEGAGQRTRQPGLNQDHDYRGIVEQMVQSETVEIAGVGPVLFERSSKARRLIISVKPFAGVRVAVPYGSSFQKAKEFAHTKVDWMQRQLARMKQYEEGDDSAGKSALDSIDRAEARRRLIRRLEYLAAEHGFIYNRVFIRNQKTRLGTCSNRNNIGLNIKVSRLPEELMDYVILHELAHTRVKNHGKEFWMLMDELVGDGKAKAARVREYSTRHLLGSP